MNRSESIKELATALAKAQMELKNPPFDSKNPHFRSNYASLASVRDTVLPVLAKHGLSVIQNVSSTDTGVRCSNLLLHASGEWIETDALEVPVDKHNAHGYVSACTYARRVSLMALATVVGDVDDDGNEAAKGEIKPLLHKPADGAYDGLLPDRQKVVDEVVTAILEITLDGTDLGEEAVAAAFNVASAADLDNDEKVALTEKLGRYSKLRRKLKEYKESLRVAE